jgi:hypothetical protein
MSRRKLKHCLCVALGLSLLLITGCSNDVGSVIERKQRELAATATARAKQEAEGSAARVKDSGNVAITLHTIQLTEKGRYVSPKEGMAFLLFDVSFANKGTDDVVISSRHMRLADVTGAVFPKTLYGGTKPEPDNTVPPGKNTRGEIAYEVPKGVQRLTWFIKGGDGAQEVSFDINLQ